MAYNLPKRCIRHAALLIVLAGLSGCAGLSREGAGPAATGPAESALPGKRSFQVEFEGGFVLDYQLEMKLSTVDHKSCYGFITGKLTNNSVQTLSRASVLDFKVIYGGRLLYRDITNPVTNIPPGGQALFGMVDSPVHSKHCPVYDRIEVSLRKVVLE
ncbi:MAG: hypothetical protein ACM3VY_00565 [Candidatus Bathyarchaeota archaeon]